ncbi:hypothetical protein RJ639_006452, partial [Escallonia herrerae]
HENGLNVDVICNNHQSPEEDAKPAMVCTAKDLVRWKDFPKGLRVLLLDEDSNSAAEIRSMLEAMDYIVSTFYDETAALSAISNKSQGFHVAVVQVSLSNSNGRFKFLESAKDLPIIMTSEVECVSTMMKCIALGAVEVLKKPLSEDKLRNIWQHVVHRVFSEGGEDHPELLKPAKESVVSMLQFQFENEEPKIQVPMGTEDVVEGQENPDQSAGSDKYPAPSTPQINRRLRLVDDGYCPDQTNCSTEKESIEQDRKSKSVETTCANSGSETIDHVSPPQRLEEAAIEEDESTDGSKGEIKLSSCPPSNDCRSHFGGNENPNKASGLHNSSGTKANRKRMKVDWTPDLHKSFVQAVEQLGVEQAIPSRILELMKVQGLTRHNIASHLQKYRLHRKHALPKENTRKWPQLAGSTQRPIMAFPPHVSNNALATSQVYPAWVPPSSYHADVLLWRPPYYPAWQSTQSWHWKPYPGMSADAWGCPVMPPPLGPSSLPQNGSMYWSTGTMHNSCSMPQKSFDPYPEEEVIDKVVKEAISKPWLPLPLGLKPPSTEGVLNELSKQGISTVPPPPPPHINGTHHR